jgi:predicted enzyme related to lactoylglutathione lyase
MAKVTDLKFSLIYADDFSATRAFYEKYFGFEDAFEMPDTELGPQAFGTIGEANMWIGGGHSRVDAGDRACRTGVMFGVESAHDLFNELKKDGVEIIQDELVEMQGGVFWFQFVDPSGNVIEVLGG